MSTSEKEPTGEGLPEKVDAPAASETNAGIDSSAKSVEISKTTSTALDSILSTATFDTSAPDTEKPFPSGESAPEEPALASPPETTDASIPVVETIPDETRIETAREISERLHREDVEKVVQYYKKGIRPKISKWIQIYRKGRAKNEIVQSLDTGTRTVTGGVTGLAGAEAAIWTLGSSLSSAYGGSFLTNILAPTGLPMAVPAASLIVRRGYAKYQHEKNVNDAYEEELVKMADAAYPTPEASDKRTAFIADFKKAAAKTQRASRQKSTVDTIQEKNLIEIMAKHAGCSPAEVPYLESVDRYTRYFFTKFRQVCEELSEDKKVDNNLSDSEQAVVDLFHITPVDTNTPNPADKMKVMKQLWEVSTEYAKLIAYEHRKNRDAQLYGQIIGGSIVAAPVLGVAPLVVGGALCAARKYYTNSRKPKELEFDSAGHLRVSANFEESADDSNALLQKEIFGRKFAESDMTDDHRYWMSLMKLDEETLSAPDIKNAKQLAFRLQEDVMRQIASNLEVSDPTKIFAFEAYEKSSQEKEVEVDIHQKKRNLQRVRQIYYGKIKRRFNLTLTRDPDPKDVENVEDKITKLSDEMQEAQSNNDAKKVSELDTEIQKLTLTHAEVKQFVTLLIELQEAEEKLKKLETSRRKELEKKFNTIREAFAMKVKAEWEKREKEKESGSHFWKNTGTGAKNAAKASAAFTVTQAATVAVKAAVPVLTIAAAYGGLYAVGAGGILNAISTVVPMPLVFTGAAVFGVIGHIRDSMKNAGTSVIEMITGEKKKATDKTATEKKEEKKEEKKDASAHH